MFRYSFAFLVGLLTAGPVAASWADSLFEELSFDFGSVPKGPMLSHPFRLNNKSNVPVHIANVRVSCGCVSAQALQTDVEPGQSTAIFAQMDTRRFSGAKSVTIYVQFDRPLWEEVHLVVQANSRDDVMLTPEALSFGQTKRGAAPVASVNVSFFGDSQSQIVNVRSESNYVQPTVKELRRDSGEVVYQVSARVRTDVPVGKWYTDIWLTTSNSSAPKIRVPLTIEVEPALSVSPVAALLGEVKTGASVERKIIVRGVKPFRIIEVKGADGQLSVQEVTEGSKPVHILAVTLKAAKAGDLSWNLRVLTDLKDENEVVFQAKAHVVP